MPKSAGRSASGQPMVIPCRRQHGGDRGARSTSACSVPMRAGRISTYRKLSSHQSRCGVRRAVGDPPPEARARRLRARPRDTRDTPRDPPRRDRPRSAGSSRPTRPPRSLPWPRHLDAIAARSIDDPPPVRGPGGLACSASGSTRRRDRRARRAAGSLYRSRNAVQRFAPAMHHRHASWPSSPAAQPAEHNRGWVGSNCEHVYSVFGSPSTTWPPQ